MAESKQNDLGGRIRQLRERLGLGRTAFAKQVGVKLKTLENSEMGRQRPPAELLSGIAEQWPEYALWLLTGEEEKCVVQVGLRAHDSSHGK